MTTNTTIIIGAGASGLLAANILQSEGGNVILIEKKHQAGMKLRITGKGRCNLTNVEAKEDYLKHISSPAFFLPAFERFSNSDLMQYFEKLGVELKAERGGRVFPSSGRSITVFLALMKNIEHNPNVKIIKDCSVKSIMTENHFVKGVLTDKGKILADNIILATGGRTYPSTGSTGDGYKILRELGHSIIRPIPALVGFRTKDGFNKEVQDFLIKNCKVSVFSSSNSKIFENNSGVISLMGDIYLDEYGVSGPIILTLSRQIARPLDEGEEMSILIDFKPKVDKDTLYKEIFTIIKDRRTESAASILRKWFPKPIINDVLKTCKINPHTMGHNLTEKDSKEILWYMKFRKMPIIGDMGWNEAIVTMGGVDLKEVDKYTMQSKKVKNLYIVGELLDLDADTGGYNLQIAFSTAYLAAQVLIMK